MVIYANDAFFYGAVSSDVKLDSVYLWELEKLNKYFPSEGEGIENVMAALDYRRAATEIFGDEEADKELSNRAKYNKLIGDHECILSHIRVKPGVSSLALRAYVRAGPREKLHFNPETVNAAIVTCGGLCPGLNNVIREITRSLFFMYGIKGKVYGIVGGYKGFYDPAVRTVNFL